MHQLQTIEANYFLLQGRGFAVSRFEDTAKKYNVKKEEKNTQIDDYNSANLENTKQPAFKSPKPIQHLK